jgi:hypothetical protein
MWEPICILCFSDFERGQRNDKPLTSLASPRFEMLSMQFKVEARAKRVALPIQGEVSFPSRKSVARPSWLAVISPTFFVKRLS